MISQGGYIFVSQFSDEIDLFELKINYVGEKAL